MNRAVSLAMVLVPLSVGTAANADPHADRIPIKARELVVRGRMHHNAGDYEAAAAAFKEAYVLAPSPGLLFNIAQSYRLAGACDESAWMYRRFLDTHPRDPHRTLAEAQLDVVEKCGNGGLRIAAPPPLNADIPRPTVAAARRSGERVDRARPPVREHVSGARLKRAGAYTLLAGGVALAGAAAFALDAHAAATAIEAAYRDPRGDEDIAALDARGERSARRARFLGIAGGTAVVTGAILYGVGRYRERDGDRTRRVAIVPTAGGAQVHLSWGF